MLSAHTDLSLALLPMFGDSQYDFEETDPPFNMSKPLDYIDSSPSNSNGPRTDAGFRAWSQVFAAHLIAFNTWGYNTSYGLFQAYYARNLDLSPSAISWVGSIQNFLIFFISTFSMHALVAGPRYYRGVLITGLALQLLGIFATSWCREYWQFLLAQGICQGVGSGLFFAPTVGLISTYFVKKRAIANAGMACGMSTGGIVFPLIARQLLQSVGFEWTLRVMGFVILFNSILILLLIRPIPSDTKQRTPFVDTTAFKDALLIKFALGMLMAVFGMYFAYYYVSKISQLNNSALTHLSDSPLCRRQIIGNRIDIIISFVGPQWYRHTRSSHPRLPRRPRSRPYKHTYYHCFVLWSSDIQLDCCKSSQRVLGICGVLWILWR